MSKEWIDSGEETFAYGSEDEATTPGRMILTPSIPSDYEATEALFVVHDFRSTTATVSTGNMHFDYINASYYIGTTLTSVIGESTYAPTNYFYFRRLTNGYWVENAQTGSGPTSTVYFPYASGGQPRELRGHWVTLDAGNIVTVTGRVYYR